MMYQNFIKLWEPYPSPSLGRFDQYTWPYLKKDLEAGTITEEYAQEIVDAFFLKANCFYQGGKGRTRMKRLRFAGRDYITLVLGVLLVAAMIVLRVVGI